MFDMAPQGQSMGGDLPDVKSPWEAGDRER